MNDTNKEQYQEAFELFILNIRESLAAIRSSIEIQDYESIAKHSHKLCGSFACFGYPHISDMARALESHCKSADLNDSDVANLVQALASEALKITCAG